MFTSDQVRDLENMLRMKEQQILALKSDLAQQKQLVDQSKAYMERMNYHYDVLEAKNSELTQKINQL